MKMKLSFGDAGIKGFFVQHVEKIAIAIVLVLVALFVISGAKQKPIDPQFSADSIAEKATAADKHIERTDWNEVSQYRFKTPTDFVGRVRLALVKVNAEQYEMPVPLRMPLFRREELRTDPPLYAAIEPEVTTGYGALLLRSGGAGAGAAAVRGESSAVATGKYFVAVKMLVPTRKQKGAYDNSFANSAGYEPGRDQPNYGFVAPNGSRFVYKVERMEIGVDGKEGEWNVIAYSTTAETEAAKWAGPPQEIAATDYVAAGLFTQPLPVMPGTDLTAHALHSKIPDRRLRKERPSETPAATPTPGSVPGPGADPFAVNTQQVTPAAVEEEAASSPTVPFKLFRYFDFTVEPGHTYKYRVMLYLEDANDPQSPERRPKVRNLAKTVIDRIAAKTPLPTGGRQYWLEGPWSEPTPAISVADTRQILAGRVTPGKKTVLPNGAEVPRSSDTAAMTVVLWDPALAANVPGSQEVERGTVANFVADATIVDPATGQARSLAGYSFRTDGIVLDLRGGTELPGRDRKNRLIAPGEVLLVDGDGQLLLLDEAEDHRMYEKFNGLSEEDIPPAAAPGAPAGPKQPAVDLFGGDGS